MKLIYRLALIALMSFAVSTAVLAAESPEAAPTATTTTTTAPVAAAPVVPPVKPALPKPTAKPAATATKPATAKTETPAKDGAAPKTTTQAYDDWQMECSVPDKSTKKVCHIFQRIVMKDKKIVALTAVFVQVKLPKAAEAMTVLRFIAPFGVLLPGGLTFGIDDDKQVTLPFQICAQKGCVTDLKLESADIEKFKKAKEVRVFYNVPGQKDAYRITLSMKGFPAAMDALKQMPAAE